MLQYFMPRSSNLDTIAPDDPISATPAPAKKLKKINKTVIPLIPAIPAVPTPADIPAPITPSQPLASKVSEIMNHVNHSLSSSLVNPLIFNFQERDEDEIIYLVLRQHWFTNVRWILSALLMLIAPILISFFPLLDFFPLNYQFIFILFWYVMTFAYAFESFLSWYFDVYIVTSDRVVDIDFNNLLNKSFAEADLAMIQDTSYDIHGIAQTVFNYASVRIQTAAEIPEIEFENVPSPEKVVKVIRELKQAREGRP